MQPNLILSDLHLPQKSGLDFLCAVKADPALAAIPFLLISSSLRNELERALCLKHGAKAFMLRPIDTAAFLQTVESALVEEA